MLPSSAASLYNSNVLISFFSVPILSSYPRLYVKFSSAFLYDSNALNLFCSVPIPC